MGSPIIHWAIVRISRPVRPACWAEASIITPTSRPGLGRSANLRPEMVAVLEVGEVSPTIIRIEVDLPAPFGPEAGHPALSGDEADVVDDGVLAVLLRQRVDRDHGRTPPFVDARSEWFMPRFPSLSACLDARKCGGACASSSGRSLVRPPDDVRLLLK